MMGQPETRATDDGSKKLLRLAEIMSNYLTLQSPPEKMQSELQRFFQERARYDELLTTHSITIQDLQQKTQRIPHLEQTIQQLQTQNTELQTKMSGLEASLDSISESQSVKDLNISLQTEVKTKAHNLNEITNELNGLKSAFETLSQRSEAFAKADQELAGLKNKLTGEWKKNQDLRQTLLNEREAIKILLQEKKGLEYALHRLERRLLQKGTLRGLSIPVRHLEISADLTGKADAEIQEQIQIMNLELQKRLDRIKELEIKNNSLKGELAKSTDRDLRLKIQKLNSDLESRQGSIMGLESTRKKLMEQMESLQQRLADSQNKVILQGKEIEEKNKNIQNLETAVSTGVHDEQARGVITSLQKQNREFRNEVRDGEKIIRSLEKNMKFFQTQLKQQKEQSYKLYNQSREQVILIQKLQTALEKGGTTVGLDIPVLETTKSLLQEDGPSLDDEIKSRDRKIQRLESYVESLKQEMEDIQFRMSSRDVKIDELNNIIQEIKSDLRKSKVKILVRPPSTDEFRKTKVKF